MLQETIGFAVVSLGLYAIPLYTSANANRNGVPFERWISAIDEYGLPTLFLLALAAIYSAIATHELGHLLTGRMLGFRFQRLAIGPVWIANVRKRLKAGLHMKLKDAFDGFTEMDVGEPRRGRLGAYNAGGLIANALFIVLLFVFHPAGTLAKLFHAELLLFSIFAILVNAAPYVRTNGMFTDGARLLCLLRSDIVMQHWMAIDSLITEYGLAYGANYGQATLFTLQRRGRRTLLMPYKAAG